jgi:hypothetical protein
MDKEIVDGYLDEARAAALELSGYIRQNRFNLIGKRAELRLRYEIMIAKIERYEEAYIRRARMLAGLDGKGRGRLTADRQGGNP